MTDAGIEQAAVVNVRCPKCRAQAHFRCTGQSVKLRYLVRPHKERVDAYLVQLAAKEGS